MARKRRRASVPVNRPDLAAPQPGVNAGEQPWQKVGTGMHEQAGMSTQQAETRQDPAAELRATTFADQEAAVAEPAEDLAAEVSGGAPAAMGPEIPAEAAGTGSIAEARQRIAAIMGTVDGERSGPQALHDTFRDERNDVMAVIEELENQLDRQQEVREGLQRELTQANDKLQVATQRIQDLEWQAMTLQARVDGLEQVRQEVTLLEEEVASANGRVQRLNDEYSGIEKERTRLKNELKAANKQLEELWSVRKERDGLRGDLKSQGARIAELERLQRDLAEERTQAVARLQDLQAACEQAQSDRHQHLLALRAAEDRAREQARVQEELIDKLEASRGEVRNLQAQIAHLERETARLAEQRQFYEIELTSLRGSNRTAEAALASVKKAFAEVRVALTETKSRARRRMIESWPRLEPALRGLEAATPATPEGPAGPAKLCAGSALLTGDGNGRE